MSHGMRAVAVMPVLAVLGFSALAQEKAILNGYADNVWCVSWRPDGKTLASASIDRTVKLWDVIPRK